MQVWFMTSFKKTEQQGEIIAQVLVSQGKEGWQLAWQTPSEKEVWYEGLSWDELQANYRFQLTAKQAEGFILCIEGLQLDWELDGKSAFNQMLFYYADQQLEKDEQLFEQLRTWRRERAVADKVAPFIIASNRVLALIAAFKPQSLEELSQLPGIGKAKLNQYGQEWLKLVAGIKRSDGFPLEWVASKIDPAEFRKWYYLNKEQQYKREWEEMNLRKQVLAGIQSNQNLTEIAESVQRSRREVIEWIERLEHDGYEIETWAEMELKRCGVEEAEMTQVHEWFANIGDTYLKPVLQKMYGDMDHEEAGPIYEKLRWMRILYRKQQKHLQAG